MSSINDIDDSHQCHQWSLITPKNAPKKQQKNTHILFLKICFDEQIFATPFTAMAEVDVSSMSSEELEAMLAAQVALGQSSKMVVSKELTYFDFCWCQGCKRG